MKDVELVKAIEKKYKRNSDKILYGDSNRSGYWSNLDESENNRFVKRLRSCSSVKELVKQTYPQYYDVIFSPKREAGLELLNLTGEELCVDYGCMWGGLTVPLAKRSKFVLGVDQTIQSLTLLHHRMKNDKLTNYDLLCENLNNMPALEGAFDVAVVNGVLEWVPEIGKIELKQYFGKEQKKGHSVDPNKMQISFLEKVFSNLNKNGKLYLAIENRYDLNMFFGLKDPHSNLRFTSILPRKVADMVSMKMLGRPYVNWLYSFPNLKKLLHSVGFKRIEMYNCFPNYRFPEYISPYGEKLQKYSSRITIKNPNGRVKLRRIIPKFVEYFIFRLLRNDFFAPSIILVAHKK